MMAQGTMYSSPAIAIKVSKMFAGKTAQKQSVHIVRNRRWPWSD